MADDFGEYDKRGESEKLNIEGLVRILFNPTRPPLNRVGDEVIREKYSE